MTRSFRIKRTYSVHASHKLEGRDLHEHIFRIDVIVAGTRDQFQSDFNNSMLINYFELDNLFQNEVQDHIVDADGRISFPDSSCENIAEWVFNRLEQSFMSRYDCSLKAIVVDDGDISATVSSR